MLVKNGWLRLVAATAAALALTFSGVVPAQATHLRGAVGYIKYDASAKTITVNSTMVERKDACTVTTNLSSANGDAMPTSGLCTFFSFPTITAVDPTTGTQTAVTACTNQATTPASWSFDYTSQPLYNIFNTVYVINANCPSFNANLDYIVSQTGSNRIGGIKNTTNQVIQFEGRVKLNGTHTTPIYNTGYMTNVAYDTDPTHTFTTNLNALDEFGKGVTYSLITSSASSLGGYGATTIPCSTLNTTTGEFKVGAGLCTSGQTYATAFSGGTATTPIYYALKTKATDANGQYVTRDVLLAFVNSTNQAPTITPDQTVSVPAGNVVNIPISARDADTGQTLKFSTNTLPSWASITTTGTNPATATVRIDATAVTSAAQVIQISATDSDPSFPLSATSNLTVVIGSGALPPAAPTIDAANTLGDGTSTSVSVRFAKPTTGGVPTSYSITLRPVNGGTPIVVGYTPVGNGPYTVPVAGTSVGTFYTIVVTANNSMGSADSLPFTPSMPTLSVSPATLNLNANAAMGSNLLTYTFTPNPPAITYSASTIPAGLSFNTTTGQFSGTPTLSGTTVVTITGSNGATTTVTIVVNAKQSQSITFPQPGVVPYFPTGVSSGSTITATVTTVATYAVRLAAYSTSGLPIYYSFASSNPGTSSVTARTSATSINNTSATNLVKSISGTSSREKCFLSSDGTNVYAGVWAYTNATTKASSCVIYAYQDGNANYTSASVRSSSLYVANTTTVSANPTFMIRGATTTPRYTYYVGDSVSHPYSLCLQSGTGAAATCVTTPSNSTSPINWMFNICSYSSVLESATSTTRALPGGLTLDLSTGCELTGTADSELPSTLVTLNLGNSAGTQYGATSSPKLQFYITVIKRTQKVTAFTTGQTMQLGGLTKQTLTATSDSGNTVLYRVTAGSANCVLSTDARTLMLANGASAGTCTVEAFLTGDTRYYPSASIDNISQTITILGANLAPTLALNAPQSATIPALSTQTDLFPISASNSAVVTWTIVDPNGNTDALAVPDGMAFDTTTGKFYGMPEGAQDFITYTISGANAAGQWSNSITVRLKITLLTQSLTFDTVSSMVSGDTRTLAARADSGLLVTFTSLNPAICVVNANGTITAISAGTCSIRADQAGNGKSWAAAASVTQNITVALALLAPNISLSGGSATVQTGEYLLPLYTIVNSGGDLGIDGVNDVFTLDSRYTTTLPAGVTFDTKWGVFSGRPTISGGPYTFGIQACNAAGCSTALFVLTISKKLQVITITPDALTLLAPRTMNVTATATSGNAVTLTVDPSSVAYCAFSNGVLTAIANGNCLINASVAGNNIYEPATSSVTIAITQAPGLTAQGSTGGSYGSTAAMTIWDGGVAASQRYALSFTGTPDARTSYSLFDAAGNDLSDVGVQGLAFDTNTGLLSGVVNWDGASAATYTVRVSNQYGSASIRFNLTILSFDFSGGTYTTDFVSPVKLITVTNGSASATQATVVASGVASGFTYALATGSALPTGLSLNTSTGAITGSPTVGGAYVTRIVASYGGVVSYSIELDSTIQSTITFSGNGSTSGTAPGTLTQNLGDIVTLPSVTVFARTGYVNAVPGWNTAANGSGTAYLSTANLTMGSANITLYAQWVVVGTYTVTFNTNYPVGTSVDSRVQSATTSTRLRVNTFTIPGYTFQGWSTSAGSSTVAYADNAIFPFTANTQLYAVWTASPLSVSVRSDAVVTLTNRTATIGGSLLNGQALSNADVLSVYLCYGNSVTAGNTLNGSVKCASNEWTSTSSLAAGAVLSFTEIAGGLNPNNTYYEQIQVNFANGTTISSTARAFTTNDNPSATAVAPISVSASQATIAGVVNPNKNKLTAVYFCWGTDLTQVQNCSRTSPIVQQAWWNGGNTSDQQFTLTITGLAPGTTYYYNLLSTAEDNNGIGTFAFHPGRKQGTTVSGGTPISFTTPSATTSSPATSITGNSATVAGTLSSGTNALASSDVTSVRFCYSLSSAVDSTGALSHQAICGTNQWTGSSSVSAGSTSTFSSTLSGLSSSTTYYYQLQVTFASGAPATAYGSVENFTTRSLITFHSNPPAIVAASDSTASQSVNGSVVLAGNPFSYTGLTFNHWTTNADGTGTVYSDGATLATTLDVDLYAQWTTNNYKVGFDAGGGAWVASQPGTVTARFGSTVVTPSSTVVTRAGYNFAGWAVGGVTYGALTDFQVPAADSVLVATWTPQTYAIQYSLAGSGGSTPATQYFIVGGSGVTLPSGSGLTPPAGQNGWTFGGWTTTSGGSSAESSPYVPNGNVTLYPVWVAPGSLTITYESNYPTGTNTTAVSTGPVGSFAIRGANTFSYTGWVIDHWVDATDPNATYALGSTATFSGNTTLMAVWTQVSYNLSYDVRDGVWNGSAPSVRNLHYGDVVSTDARPAAPTGYTFVGWNDGANTYSELSNYSMPASDVLLSAVYSVNSYTASFDPNGGSWMSGSPSGSYSYGSTIVLPATSDVRRSGYTLLGWTIGGVNYAPGDPFVMGATGVSITARWQGDTYTVTYDANNGSFSAGPANDTYTVGSSSAIALPVTADLGVVIAPVAGYIFSGWALDAAGLAPVQSLFTPSGDVRLYAIWLAPSAITVSYNSGYPTGSGLNASSSSASVTPGSVTVQHSFTAPTGYQFDHWTDGSTSYSNGATYSGYLNLGLTAVWSKINYTVSYDAGTGAWVTSAPANQTVNYQDSLTSEADSTVSKTGYSFSTWSYLLGGQTYTVGSATSFSAPAADIQLVAEYVINNYAVNYSLGSGSWVTTDPSGTSSYGSTITLPRTTDVRRTGYSLAGWSLDGRSLNPGATFTIDDRNANIQALWLADVYTVTFDMNGGVVAETPADQQFTYDGTGLSLDVRAFTAPSGLSGYTFGGWALTPGSSVAVSDSNYQPTQDTRLYAIWMAPGSFTIDYQSGYPAGSNLTDTTSSQAASGSSVNLSGSFPAPTGYTFSRWTDGSQTYSLTGTYTGGAPVTLTAVWTQLNYSLGYDAGLGSWSGSAPSNQTLHYGDSVTTESRSVVARVGYTFAGWSLPENGSTTIVGENAAFIMRATDVTLTARYTVNSYTVTYGTNGGNWTGSNPSGSQNYGSSVTLPATTDVRRTGYTFAGWLVGGNTLTSGGSSFNLGDGNVTIEARWIGDTYLVSFNLNGGSATSAPTSASYTVGTSSAMHLALGTEMGTLTAPVAGYLFTGWSETQGGSTALVGDYTPAVSVTLYAIWQAPATISVRYNTGYPISAGLTDSSATASPAPGSVSVSHTFTAPNGYHFNYWTDGTTQYSNGAVYSGYTNLEVTAVWVANDYTLGYEAGVGSWATSAPATQVLHIGDSVTTAARTVVVNPGYHFDVWTYNGGVSSVSELTGFTMPAANVTLAARYVANTYTVGYLTDGGTWQVTDPTGVQTYGTIIQLPSAASVTKTGFNFVGWVIGGVNYAGGAFYTVPVGDSTLTARWQDASVPVAASHSVTFNSNYPVAVGRTDGSFTQTANTASALASPFGTPAGYAFLGWSTTIAGSVGYVDGANYGFAADLVLYAQWKNLAHVLTLHANNGGAATTVTQVSAAAAAILANPWSKVGYTFAGWNTQANGNGTSFTDGQTYDFTTDGVLYAQWKAVPLPPITPVPVVTPPAPGTSQTSDGGKNVPTTLLPNQTTDALDLTSDGWSLKFAATDLVGKPTKLDSQGRVILQDGQYAHASGTGFKPNTEVHLYVFSSPILLGIMMTDANGDFQGQFPVPAGLEVGTHTVQVDGYSPAGTIRSASVPAVVLPAVGKALHAKFYFAPNSAVISSSVAKQIKKLATKVARGYLNLQVGVVGFVNHFDNATANAKVSAARAKNVAILLKKSGLAGLFVSQGKGRAPESGAKARRVEVSISYQLKPVVQ